MKEKRQLTFFVSDHPVFQQGEGLKLRAQVFCFGLKSRLRPTGLQVKTIFTFNHTQQFPFLASDLSRVLATQ